MFWLGWKIGRLLRKRWEVTGSMDTESTFWYRKKNADIYCKDMNDHSAEWFHGEKFEVVRN